MSDEVIKSPTTNNSNLAPTLEYAGKKMHVRFHGSCLIKQDKITFDNRKIVNTCIVYDIDSNLNNFDPTLENILFGAFKITKNSDIYKYKYSAYGIGFDARGTFSFARGSFAQNVTVFGAYMSISVHANNRTKNILSLGQGIMQGLDDTILTAEKMYQVNFSTNKKKFCLSLHYNGVIIEII